MNPFARMPVLALATVCIATIALAGCGRSEPRREANGYQLVRLSNDHAAERIQMPMTAPAAAPAGQAGAAANVAVPRMLARKGAAVLEVESLDSAVAAVRRAAGRAGGWIAGENIYSGRNELRHASFQVMVPATRLDEAIAGLRPIGRIESVQVGSEDVGQEYVDVNARLANRKRLEARMVTLLNTRTGRLEDVLAVERELTRVREEIDRLTGRTRYLERQVATSRLQVSVHEPAPLTGAPGSNRVVGAFRVAWRNFVSFVAGFIAALGFLIPVGAIGAGAWWGAGRFRRRRRVEAEA